MFDYFTQLFAQVTNPPLDAIREELVTSLASTIGPEGNMLRPGPASCRQIVLPFPVISNADLAKIVHINEDGNLPGFAAYVVDGRYRLAGGGGALAARLAEICADVSAAIARGARIIVLSDRPGGRSARRAPIPSLLLTGAVHHHLIRERTRTRVGLVVEAGDVRESHHVALLIGYGAAAVNPYLAIETVADLVRSGVLDGTSERKAEANLIKALGKGVLKIMSKMGVSTVASYTGAQIFEAVGLGEEVIGGASPAPRRGSAASASTCSPARSRGAAQLRSRAACAAPPHRRLETGGEYQWRRDGEPHLFNPETVFKLQHATRSRPLRDLQGVHRLNRRPGTADLMTLRGLLRDPRRGRGDRPAGRRCRSRRSSRSARSSGGSPQARCPTDRFRRRRTRPSRSR